MKITLIGTLPPIKGISEYCIEQVNSLSKKMKIDFINFKSIYPEFLYPGGSTKEKNEIFQINENKNLKISNLLSWYNPFSWVWAGLTTKGEIVHFHWWTFYLFPVFFIIIILSKLRGKKIICTAHNVLSHETSKIDEILTNLMFKLSHRIIVHSKTNKNQLKEVFKIKDEKISVIPYGVLNFYKKEEITKEQACEKLGLENQDKIILYFGNIRKYKGVDVLIKSFAKTKKEVSNAKLIIAGKNWIDWQPFQRLINGHNLNKDIILHLDYISALEIPYYFSACDLVVLPYLFFESQSGPGNIALAFRKAMVVSNVGGLPDLVKDKNVIVQSNNEDELAQAIIKILKDENFRTRLENDSKELAQKYSWDKIAEKTIELYKSLTKTNQHETIKKTLG